MALNKSQEKKILLWAAAIIFIWFFSFYLSRTVPYLYTTIAFKLRSYFLTPALTALLFWFIFVYRWNETGMTGFEMAYPEIKGRNKRFLIGISGALSIFLLSLGVAWTSISFPIWLVKLTASDDFNKTYNVVSIHAVSNMYDLRMIDIEKSEIVDLRLTAFEFKRRDWGQISRVCLVGKTSIFGAIVESISNDTCKGQPIPGRTAVTN